MNAHGQKIGILQHAIDTQTHLQLFFTRIEMNVGCLAQHPSAENLVGELRGIGLAIFALGAGGGLAALSVAGERAGTGLGSIAVEPIQCPAKRCRLGHHGTQRMLEVALQGAQRGVIITMLTRQPHMPLMHGEWQQPSPQGDARGETQGLHRINAHGIEIEQRLRAVSGGGHAVSVARVRIRLARSKTCAGLRARALTVCSDMSPRR